jgi:hypothetical protein
MTMTEGSGDDNVLDGVFDREPPQEAGTTGATVETTESTEAARARDERGRFAAKSESEPQAQAQTEQAPVEQQTQAQDPNANRQVPLSELLSERKQRQEEQRLRMEAEARAKAYEQINQRQPQHQPPPQAQIEPPDFITDPEGALSYHLQRQHQQHVNMMLNQSEIMARDKFGDELVDAALKAAQTAGATGQFMDKPHPWGELVKWHKRQQTLQVVGDDPDAFRKKIEEEVRQKVLAELKAGGAGAAAAPRIPGTLATATGQGEQGAHLTDEAAMGSIFASGRNRKTG